MNKKATAFFKIFIKTCLKIYVDLLIKVAYIINMSNGDKKMSRKQPKFFTQNIPSTQKNTEFLLNLLEDLLNSNTLTKSQKNKLDHILDISFNQIEILSKKDYHTI